MERTDINKATHKESFSYMSVRNRTWESAAGDVCLHVEELRKVALQKIYLSWNWRNIWRYFRKIKRVGWEGRGELRSRWECAKTLKWEELGVLKELGRRRQSWLASREWDSGVQWDRKGGHQHEVCWWPQMKEKKSAWSHMTLRATCGRDD